MRCWRWRRVVTTAAVAVMAVAGGAPAVTASVASAAPPRPALARRVNCLDTRCVALTFDDGPSRYTASLLRDLEAQHATATFFLIGPHALQHRRDVLREYRDGDAIGDHTVHHPHLTRIPSAQVSYELDVAARQIASITGHRPTLMRPPFGDENARVRALARRAGLAVIIWNVDPRDWKHHNATFIERSVLAHVRPGAIVDLHDKYRTTIPAVPYLVDALRARGYVLVTVPQLFAQVGGVRPGVAYFHGP